MSIASLENHYINLLTPLSAGVDISDSCLFLLIGLLGEVPMMKSESSFCFNKAILLSILSSRHFNWKKNTHHIFHSYEFFLQWLTDLSINEIDLLYTFLYNMYTFPKRLYHTIRLGAYIDEILLNLPIFRQKYYCKKWNLLTLKLSPYCQSKDPKSKIPTIAISFVKGKSYSTSHIDHRQEQRSHKHGARRYTLCPPWKKSVALQYANT